jgi:3-oxoacyl-[acyl-carrier protein] reductase
MARTILVTGASKGIGQAIAARLARDGFTLVVHYHSDSAGAEATLARVREAGADGRLLRFDIADREAARLTLEADIAAHGPYWGIVLNAGIARDNAFPAMEDDDWDKVLGTNLGGFYNASRCRQSRDWSAIVVRSTIPRQKRASSAPPRRWLWSWPSAALR